LEDAFPVSTPAAGTAPGGTCAVFPPYRQTVPSRLPVSHRPSLDAVQAETRAVRNGRHQQQKADAQQQKHRRFLP